MSDATQLTHSGHKTEAEKDSKGVHHQEPRTTLLRLILLLVSVKTGYLYSRIVLLQSKDRDGNAVPQIEGRVYGLKAWETPQEFATSLGALTSETSSKGFER